MKEYERIALAKCIRNLVHVPIGYKEEFVYAICKSMQETDQFFNTKQFKSIALDTLPEGWPNRV